MMGYPSIYHEINSSDENQTADYGVTVIGGFN